MSGFSFGSGKSVSETLKRFGNATERTAKRELPKAAEPLEEEIRDQLDRPGSGRVYSHGRGRLGRRLHVASKPGEPPSPDSGKLRDSTRVERDGESVRVVVTGEGAAALEWGTRTIAPRPFMRPALAAAKNRMGSSFAAKLRKGR